MPLKLNVVLCFFSFSFSKFFLQKCPREEEEIQEGIHIIHDSVSFRTLSYSCLIFNLYSKNIIHFDGPK